MDLCPDGPRTLILRPSVNEEGVGMQRPRLDLATIKERQQLAWSSGDYAMFGAALLIMSELLCEAVDLRPGQTILDVATGSGNTALAAARRFGETTGIDYVPAPLERGGGGAP